MKKNAIIGVILISLTITVTVGFVIFKTRKPDTIASNENEKEVISEANYKTDTILNNAKIEVSKKVPKMSNEGLKIELIKDNYISLDNLKVPYINVQNSEDINKRMNGLYKKYEKKFQEIVKKDLSTPIFLNYKTYINDNVTSIVIIHGTYEKRLKLDYITINIDNDKKQVMSIEDILKKLDKTYNTTYAQLTEKVEKYINDNYTVDEQTIYTINEMTSTRTVTLENLEMLVMTNTINYFTDESGKLKYIIPITLNDRIENVIFEI